MEIRYVDDRGDADFATIREATAAAPRGDTIVILPGTYASGFAGKVPHPTIQPVTICADEPIVVDGTTFFKILDAATATESRS